MKLEDIRPERASFKLKATGKEYFIRPFNLDDELWLQRTYGEGLKKIFDQGRFHDICRIAYRQLEDRSEFVKQKVKIVNEQGDHEETEIGGLDLFYAIVRGMEEKMAILQALLSAIGLSRPIQDELIADEISNLKKKAEAAANTATQSPKSESPSGPNVSTSSPTSTGGQPIISGR